MRPNSRAEGDFRDECKEVVTVRFARCGGGSVTAKLGGPDNVPKAAVRNTKRSMVSEHMVAIHSLSETDVGGTRLPLHQQLLSAPVTIAAWR